MRLYRLYLVVFVFMLAFSACTKDIHVSPNLEPCLHKDGGCDGVEKPATDFISDDEEEEGDNEKSRSRE